MLMLAKKKYQYGLNDFSQYLIQFETNLPLADSVKIDAFDEMGYQQRFTAYKFAGQSSVRMLRSAIEGLPLRLVARFINKDGVAWVDRLVYLDGIINIQFQSQGATGGTGELKTFNGSIAQDGQPVARAVYALAIGDGAPKLLANTVSDAAGNYSLEWNGYAGQILITAIDDYGELFAGSTLLSIGARIHPATPNGYVYEAASAGALGIVEPIWPAVESESVTSGEVQLVAKPFYRPKSAGPFTID